ncbi:MAG: insulinase family protein [Treponema sp.]|nr:insulinase family protein [Treponema sp.]
MSFDFTDSKNVGKEYKNFVLLSVEDLSDFKAKGVYLRHKITGLEVFHFVNDDKENTFAFAFRTIEKNSKGFAHIMEHSVLCGSEKYPLKEPFNTLSATSLNTFLNAMTYPDKTVYPGASVVENDYFTMMDVYADAVFFPKLDYQTFIQEGHRLELDKDGNLSIQGVVYNEMKAPFSSFTSVAFSNLISAMFPDSYPSYESGGDPLDIPTMTYEEFLDFHQKFYSPDNCLLFLCGNIPTDRQLDFFEERFISRLEKKYNCKEVIANYNSKLPLVKAELKDLQTLKKHDKSVEYRGIAPETGATGNFVNLSWYTGPFDIEKIFLFEVLCGNDSAPLYKGLQESGLGDDVNSGNFGQFYEEFFSLGLWGVKKGNENKVFKLIDKLIKEVYKKGVSQKEIESAIMGIDFNLRELNRYWGPFSLTHMEAVLKSWTVGNSCSRRLFPISDFENFKLRLKEDKDYIKKLIRKYLIDNPIRVKVIEEPSADFLKNRQAAEKKLIEEKSINLDREKLQKDLDKLHAYQQKIESPEETACIPSTKLSSLDENVELIETEVTFAEGENNTKVPLFINKENTNGIFYMDVLFPFDNLDVSLYKYIPLLTTVMTNLGWNGKKWDECVTEASRIMGDAWGRTSCGSVADVPECLAAADKYKELNICGRNWIGISCKALTEKAEETLELITEMLTKMSFDDKKHFESILQEVKAEKKSNIVNGGKDYALKRVRAKSSADQALREIMMGITQLDTINSFDKISSAKLLKILKNIYFECLNAGGIIHITSDEDSIKKLMPSIHKFAKDAKIKALSPVKKHTLEEYLPYIYENQALNSDECQVIQVDSQTGYAASCIKSSPYLTNESVAEAVFASWFSMHTLWDKIRTSGGAYGANSWADSIEKNFVMYSYRDPDPVKSLEVYIKSLEEVANLDIHPEDIEKTIVSIYGDSIVPITPKDKGDRGLSSILYANPQALRPEKIRKLFNVKLEDVKAAAKRISESAKKECSKAVFCDKSVNSSGNFIKIPL